MRLRSMGWTSLLHFVSANWLVISHLINRMNSQALFGALALLNWHCGRKIHVARSVTGIPDIPKRQSLSSRKDSFLVNRVQETASVDTACQPE